MAELIAFAPVVGIDDAGHRARIRERRDALVAEYSYLVRPIAQAIKLTLPPSFELEDLVQEGMIALLHAATRFRPDLYPDMPFHLYARKRIRGALLDFHSGRNWTNSTLAEMPATSGGAVTVDHDTAIEQSQKAAKAKSAIRRLDRQSQRVIETYYSEGGGNFERTAKVVGIDRRRVGEVHATAITRLRAMCVGA